MKYSVKTVNRCRRSLDGETAYTLRSTTAFCEGDSLRDSWVTKGVARIEARWRDGIFLGVSDRSDEFHVGTDRGIHKVRTLRRRDASERVDNTFLDALTARLWDGKRERKKCEWCCWVPW